MTVKVIIIQGLCNSLKTPEILFWTSRALEKPLKKGFGVKLLENSLNFCLDESLLKIVEIASC